MTDAVTAGGSRVAFVAEVCNGRPTGLVFAHVDRAAGASVRMGGMWVNRAFRGKRIGDP
jgi:hypothetical protein